LHIESGHILKVENGDSISVTEVNQSIHQFRAKICSKKKQDRSIWDFCGKNLENLPGYDVKLSLRAERLSI